MLAKKLCVGFSVQTVTATNNALQHEGLYILFGLIKKFPVLFPWKSIPVT